MNERIVALDIGDVRIGVAVSDATRTIATPVEVITRVGWGPDTRKIKAICERYDTAEVLSGLPRNMDGSEGFQAGKVRALCAQLEAAGLHVHYWDERLTTVAAEHALLEDGQSRAERKGHVDMVAAAVILQGWLDHQHNTAKEAETMDEENNIIELVDEDGNEVSFELLTVLEHENATYLALMPQDAQEDENDEETNVVFMEVTDNGDGEECYEAVDDEALCDTLFEKLLALLSEGEEDELPDEEV